MGLQWWCGAADLVVLVWWWSAGGLVVVCGWSVGGLLGFKVQSFKNSNIFEISKFKVSKID